MKTPFQFPTYEEWCLVSDGVHASLADISRNKSNAPQLYALSYLTNLRDWVNEGWEPRSPHHSDYFVGIRNEYHTFTKKNRGYDYQWVPDMSWKYIVSLFNFESSQKAEEFLSHKSETTNTIEQLNILYSIHQ